MTKHFRGGEKMSFVMKNGIIVHPIPLPVEGGGIVSSFRIEVTKQGKDGNTIVQASKEPNKRYPATGSKHEPSVWEVIMRIYDYYYDKLIEKQKPKTELNEQI
jgi:hypothetical protein